MSTPSLFPQPHVGQNNPECFESGICKHRRHGARSAPQAKNVMSAPGAFAGSKRSRREELDRQLQKLEAAYLPGLEHAREYLWHQYIRNAKANTIRNNRFGVQLFLSFLRTIDKRGLEQVTRKDIEAFVEFDQDRGLKPRTVCLHLQQIYAFLRHLVEKDIIDSEILLRKIKLRLPETLPRAIPSHDVKRILAVIDDIRDRAMVLTLLRTGMRIGELLATRVAHVNLRDRNIAIYEGEKNRCGRVVLISDDARDALDAWFMKRDFGKAILFYATGKDSMTYGGARKVFMTWLARAGLSHKGYTLHCLRHTFATDLLNAGMRLECLQVLMGHQNLEITRRYARLSDRTREKEYFKAMARVERGETDDQQLNCELPEILEAEKLLASHG